MLKDIFVSVLAFLGLVVPVEQVILPAVEVESQESAVLAISSPPEVPIEDMASSTPCSCIAYVRALSEFQPPRVATALDIPVIAFEPKIGYWALFSYQPAGHVALVSAVGTDTIDVLEFNKKPCKEERRTVSKKDPYLRGYFGYDNKNL